jgi:hypothetical protein
MKIDLGKEAKLSLISCFSPMMTENPRSAAKQDSKIFASNSLLNTSTGIVRRRRGFDIRKGLLD